MVVLCDTMQCHVVIYRLDPKKSGGGTQSFSITPRAYMAKAFFSLAMAVYILGRYSWRHRGDF